MSAQSQVAYLATLVNAAHADPVLRELSTSTGYQVAVGNRTLQYNNTNRLTKNPEHRYIRMYVGLEDAGYLLADLGQALETVE